MSDAYLITAQTLLDLCADEGDAHAAAAQAWADGVAADKMRISVVSVAQARAAVDGIGDISQRRGLTRRLDKLLASVTADGGPPSPFDRQAATVWQELIADPKLRGIAQTDRQVIATALERNLAIVEAPRLQHGYLKSIGLSVAAL